VIAGTASATADAVGRRSGQRAVGQQQAAAFRQQQQAMPVPDGAGADLVTQLGELGRLRDAGVLTELEFDAAKKRVLGP
jgi:hypothetical protein